MYNVGCCTKPGGQTWSNVAYLNHRKYNKIRRFGTGDNNDFFNYPEDEVVIEEKFDGACFQFFVAGKVTPGTPLPIGIGSKEQMVSLGDNQWYDWVQAIFDTLAGKLDKINPRYTYYVELCKKHEIIYDWEEIPKNLGIDIWDHDKQCYLGYDEKVDQFVMLGVSPINLIWRGQIQSIDARKLKTLIPQSFYRSDGGQAGGIIVKNYHRDNRRGRQMFIKIVSQEFQEKSKLSSKPKEMDIPLTEAYLIEVFGTPARVHKHALQLAEDRGMELSMELMSDLIKRVSDDILIEEMVGLSYNREIPMITINFRRLRNGLAPLIREALENLIMNRALEVVTDEYTDA